MKFASALIGAAAACSSSCSCDAGFKLQRGVATTMEGVEGLVNHCTQSFDMDMTYLEAQVVCQELGTTFPYVNSEEELTAWSDAAQLSWVQAQKSFWGSWKDWNGKTLRSLMWYEDLDDENADEPTRGDKYGYISNGAVWGASKEGTHPFICSYPVDQFCNRV